MVFGIDAGLTLMWRVGTFVVTHYKIIFLLFITFNIFAISEGVYTAGRTKPLANSAVEFLFDYTWNDDVPLQIEFVSPQCFEIAEEKDRKLLDTAGGIADAIDDVGRDIGDGGQILMKRMAIWSGIDTPKVDLTTIPLPSDTFVGATKEEIVDAIVQDYISYSEDTIAKDKLDEGLITYEEYIEGGTFRVDTDILDAGLGSGGTTSTTSVYDITTSTGSLTYTPPGSIFSGVIDTVSDFAGGIVNLGTGTYDGVTTFFSNIFGSSIRDQSGLGVDLPTEVIKVGETKTVILAPLETDPTFNDTDDLEDHLDKKEEELISGKCKGFPLLTALTQIPLLGSHLNSVSSIKIDYPPLKLLFLAMKANLVLFGIILPFTSWTYNYYGAFKR